MIKRPSSTRARSWISASLLGVAAAAALGLALFTSTPSFAQDAAAAAPAAAEAVAAAPEAEAAPVAEAAPAAEAEVTPEMNKGDNAWIMMSTVLVLAMIVPGLGLFYGGLVRSKNMLSVLMQVTACAAIGMIAWVFWGYSLAFTDGANNAFLGGTDRLFLAGVTPDSTAATFSDGFVLPELTFIAFQMTFAAITAALVLGAVVERMKFSAVVIFAILWPLLSYYPIAHMVWWAGGFLFDMGALDFAGGTVVHINAGISGLVGALILGARRGYGTTQMPPHSLVMTLIGAGLLWFGWFGFNAGSNLEATGGASLAIINTLVATAAAGLSWALFEGVFKGKPSMLGLASGIISGLVAVTPAAGLIGPVGAIVLGFLVSPICLFFCSTIKNALKYDDSLDVFGIHGIGGIVGALATGVLTAPSLGGVGAEDFNIGSQLMIQATAVGVAIVWAAVASIIVFGILKFVPGMRVSPEVEEEGLDIAEHGERAYHN